MAPNRGMVIEAVIPHRTLFPRTAKSETVILSSTFLRIGLVLACLAGPIVWGVVVNWLFNSWQQRGSGSSSSDSEPVFPDYQI